MFISFLETRTPLRAGLIYNGEFAFYDATFLRCHTNLNGISHTFLVWNRVKIDVVHMELPQCSFVYGAGLYQNTPDAMLCS